MARIVVVEPAESLAPVYKTELESDHHEVLSASSAQEVLHLLEDDAPDLIVWGIPLTGAEALDPCARLLVKHPWFLIRMVPSVSDGPATTRSAQLEIVKSANRLEICVHIRQILARPVRPESA